MAGIQSVIIKTPDGSDHKVEVGSVAYNKYLGLGGVVSGGSTPAPSPTPTYVAPKPTATVAAPAPTTSGQTSLYSSAASYAGPSITDFLRTASQPSDFASRQTLASQYGIQNYTGTASQNTQLLNILKGYATGNVSPLGVPNTLGTAGSMPSPTSPIPANALGPSGLADLNKILGANLPPGTVSSDIAGLLSLYGETTASQKEYEGFQSKLTELMGTLGEESEDLQDELENQGVMQSYQQVKELTLKAAQLKGELEKFDAETLQLSSNIENQAIPTGLILGQQGQLQKQRDLTRLSKAAELSGTIALAQAYQGNAQLGLELATKMVDLKYAPILNQINVLKTQLGFAQEKLGTEDQKRSKIIGALLDLKLNDVEEEKAQTLNIQKLAIEAASNGAPLSVVNAMRSASDTATAASLGSAYIKGDLESIAKSGSGSGGGGSSGGGSGSGSTYKFTATQINRGSAAAGVSLDDFKTLPGDVQNFYVNNAAAVGDFNDVLAEVRSGETSAEAVIQTINSLSLPQTVKEFLIAKVREVSPEGGGSSGGGTGGGFWSTIGGALSGAWSGVKSFFGL